MIVNELRALGHKVDDEDFSHKLFVGVWWPTMTCHGVTWDRVWALEYAKLSGKCEDKQFILVRALVIEQ
jgi:hypothetical protein